MSNLSRLQIPYAFADIFEGKARYRVAYGGRGSSKSWTFARMLVLRAFQQKTRILCARELQNSIKDSVHKLLVDQIYDLKLGGFETGESFIRHANGSEFIFRGIRSNASEIKSMEGIDVAWVEEAQKVSKSSWELLIPTIRGEDSEIWVTFNPEFEKDETSQRFIEKPPPDSKVAKINWSDNPWFPESLLKEKEYLRNVDKKAYMNVWEGEYKDPSHGGRVVKGWNFANVDDGIAYNPEKKLYLTMDFNVDPMCWAVAHLSVIEGKRHYHFFDELVYENTNINYCLEKFVERYGKHDAGIIITGDANSGRARSDMDELTRTRWTKIRNILSDWGVRQFTVESDSANPSISKRIEAFENLVCNRDGLRRVKASPNCKQIINVMEGLRYVPGTDQVFIPTPAMIKEDNSQKFLRDDMFDAVSYLTWKYDPIINEVATSDKSVTVPNALNKVLRGR